MPRFILPLLPALFLSGLRAETSTLTLAQAVQVALKQNPDVELARLDEQKAIQAVRLAKDPFTPRIGVGSGFAYSSGFPLSIEGGPPSVFQARATQYIYNRQQSYLIAEARESARGTGISVAAKQDEVAHRIASLYVDAERAARIQATLAKQVDILEKVAATIRSRVEEGRELPLQSRKAALSVARARQQLQNLEADREAAETALAIALGFTAEDRVRAAEEDRRGPEMPASEETAIESALKSSKELRRLESALVAKGLQIRALRAARLPRIDLVAQYGLFAKYNKYEDYFRRFERHNGQLGISLQVPLLPGPGISAQTAQGEADSARLRLETNQTRNQITQQTRQAFRDIRKAESTREVAKLDLDVAREQVSLRLALLEEGRALLREVEEARFEENEKWIAFYDAQYAVERAQWNLLRQTGELVAALR